MRTYSQTLKTASSITLAFFLWSFGPLFQIPTAIAAQPGQRAVSKAQGGRTGVSPVLGPAEQFEKTVESLRENINTAAEKVLKNQDITAEVAEVKKRRAAINEISSVLRSEFNETEKRLKAAGLPQQILDRHYAFTTNFEKNLKELTVNLDGIEKAGIKADKIAAIKKTKEHLLRVKPQRPHIVLDPNNLPHQNRKVKGKHREPRTKEQYEKDFPQQKTRIKLKTAESRLLPDLIASRPHQKPVLLAFNETASDVPLSLGVQSSTLLFASVDTSPLLLAQAADTPTPEDLGETAEIQFTDDIRAKAQELGCSPVKLYEFTRNSIEFVPTYGSIQGADMCLQTKQCNAFDTSSLLISLLRSCNIPARYVYGTVEMPIDKVKNWVGGFTDSTAALTLMASGGVPVAAGISGGVITKARIEHVWVDAWIDYIPSRGAAHKQGDTWIQLDASFKEYLYRQGIDVQALTGVNTQEFLSAITAGSTIDPTTNAITNVPVANIQNQLDTMINSLNSHVNNNMPNAMVGDVFGGKTIIQQNYRILPASLPYKVIASGTPLSQITDDMRHKITIAIDNSSGFGQPLTYTAPLPQCASKKLSLSYMPATDADAQLLTMYGHYDVRPYLIKLQPILYIDGTTVASGASVGMGEIQNVSITFTLPDGSTDKVTHQIPASSFATIGLDLQRIPLNQLTERKTKLDQALSQLGTLEVPVDDIIGELLNLHSLAYFFQLEIMNRLSVQGKVAYSKQPEEMLTTLSPNIGYLYGMPFSISGLGMKVDVRRYVMTVVSLSGDINHEKAFMLMAGHNSSAAEHAVFEEITPDMYAVSAVKIMSEAMKQGIPIYEINSANIGVTLPRLQITSETRENITNAVASGKKVYIPERSIQYYDWRGDGYEIIDPSTNAGAYMISGGLAGGGTAQNNSGLPFTMDTLLQAVGFTTLREAFRQISDTTPGFSTAVEALRRWAGPAGVIINSVFSYLNMYQDTDSSLSGLAAGLGTFGLGMLAWAFLGWALPGLGLITSVIAITATIMLTMILRSIILDYISSSAFFKFMHRHYAHKKYLPIGEINVT